MRGTKPDERIRTPMQWSADGPAGGFSTAQPWEQLADDWATVNVAAQTGDPASLLSTYRGLVATRAANEALRRGATSIVEGDAEPVIGWLRSSPGQTLLAVVNVGDEAVSDYGLTLDAGPLCGPTAARVVTAVGEVPTTAPVAPVVTAAGGFDAWRPFPTLGARSGVLLELNPAP
jgi:glycosidase